VYIAENLTNLEKLIPLQQFEITALPLRIHADSSPARIVAKILA
jgi:kynurenine formamidase